MRFGRCRRRCGSRTFAEPAPATDRASPWNRSYAAPVTWGFAIRPVGFDDVAAIRLFQRAALFVPPGAAPFPDDLVDQPDIAQYWQELGGRAGDVGRVAVATAGEIIGAVWARLLPDGYGFVDDATPEMSIAVDPAHRNRGVGSSLIEALLAEVPRCSLSVDTRNPAAALYERFGFTTVRRDGEWSVVMVRGRGDC